MGLTQINPQQIALAGGVVMLAYWAWSNRGQLAAMLPKREATTEGKTVTVQIKERPTSQEIVDAVELLRREFKARNDPSGVELAGLVLVRFFAPEHVASSPRHDGGEVV